MTTPADPQTDPVCGMTVHDLAKAPQSTYEGNTYYFCGQGCKTRFDENPQQFTAKT
jgi:P-type Cu+ transporter